MKRLFFLLALFASLAAPIATRAQATFGEVAATFPVNAAKLLADPVRNRVYAVVSASNSLVVIDTTTFQTTTIAVGSEPADLSISPDDTTLYIANSGSSTAAISVVDLNTLTTGPTITLPGAAQTIVAGPGGYLYVTLSNSSYTFQVNTATGTSQTVFGEYDYYQPLRLGPDGKTLYVAGYDLATFDVSTATPTLLLTSELYVGGQLALSHNGKYFCLPAGSNSGVTSDSTSLYSTADLSSIYGSFSNNNSPGLLAFSIDDSLVYQYRTGTQAVIDIFSTQTFAQVQEVNLPVIGSETYFQSLGSLIIDCTGSYLFYTETYYDSNYNTVNAIVALTTGTGTLTPPSFLPAITSSLSANATENQAFTYQITASNTPTSFNAANLPTGLSVNTATGLISGTPTGYTGDSDAQISATNASGTTTATLVIDVKYGAVPVISSSLYATATEYTPFTYQITASNTPTSFNATNLPIGLSVNTTTGLITGTPTGESGYFDVLISATNANGTGSATLELEIDYVYQYQPPVITTTSLPNAVVGQAYSAAITATNSPSYYEADGLPPGLSIDSSTGLITGKPTTAATYSVTIYVSNDDDEATATLELTVKAVATPAPVVGGVTVASAQVGSTFTYQIAASNFATGFSASGLPPGLTVNPSTGLISGAPTTVGTFPVLLSATNAGGTGSATLTITVMAVPAPVIAPPPNLTAMVGQAFSYQIVASNEPTGFTAGNLPSGLTVDGSTGLISGTPLVSGTSTVAISVTNASGTSTASFALAVFPALPTVNIVATVPRVTVGSGDHGAFTINRTGDLTQKLFVSYSIKGTAKNGTDYYTITGRQKIKPNKASGTIQITPADGFSGDAAKSVKITLLQSGTYELGDLTRAKVKIVPAAP